MFNSLISGRTVHCLLNQNVSSPPPYHTHQPLTLIYKYSIYSVKPRTQQNLPGAFWKFSPLRCEILSAGSFLVREEALNTGRSNYY